MSLEVKKQAIAIAVEHENADSSDFVLKYSNQFDSDLLREIALHIDFRKKIKHKVPSWYRSKELLAPQSINIQQSSSEATAQYKAKLVQGKKGLDLTGGLGVDSYFLSKKFDQFTYNEPDQSLTEIVEYNFKQLDRNNILFTHFLAEEYPLSGSFDWVYLDPSRRDERQKKLFKISDCQPDLSTLSSEILKYTENIMVKYSPMLDIKIAINQLEYVNRVLVIADKNEVKELVFILAKGQSKHIPIGCINLNSNHPEFWFTYEKEATLNSDFTNEISGYLYEPNAAILKAGAFKTIGVSYSLNKLSTNSHLYNSKILQTNFPGKVFEILGVTKYSKKEIYQWVKDGKANVSTRNFPNKPDEIKRALKLKDGGDLHLFFTQTNKNNKIVVITKQKL